jgi:hypothetical protein
MPAGWRNTVARRWTWQPKHLRDLAPVRTQHRASAATAGARSRGGELRDAVRWLTVKEIHRGDWVDPDHVGVTFGNYASQ